MPPNEIPYNELDHATMQLRLLFTELGVPPHDISRHVLHLVESNCDDDEIPNVASKIIELAKALEDKNNWAAFTRTFERLP